LSHFEKMGLTIFTTNDFTNIFFGPTCQVHEYLHYLLAYYYFFLEVNLLQNDMMTK
jgi:hypothetical protein